MSFYLSLAELGFILSCIIAAKIGNNNDMKGVSEAENTFQKLTT